MRRRVSWASWLFLLGTGLAVGLLAPGCAPSSPKQVDGFDGGGGDTGGGDPDGTAFDIGGLDDVSIDSSVPVGDPKTCAQAEAAKSYIGCDYWPTVTANAVWSIFDFAVVVANAGDEAAEIEVSGPGLTGSKKDTVPPGELRKVYLPWVKALKGADADECGSSPSMDASVKVAKGAFHLTSTRPVTVYQFNALEYEGKGGPSGKSWSTCPGKKVCSGSFSAIGCFSFSNDASLLLPSSAMSGTYRVTGMNGSSYEDPLFGDVTPIMGTYVTITGTVDDTNVTVKLGAKASIVAGGGIPKTAGGGTVTFKLNAGDVVELVTEKGEDKDLSGSLITADKSVQVLSGVSCRQVPTGVQACDHLEESVFPAETLGKEYAVTVPTGPNGKGASHLVRIYGNVDGTTLEYEGSRPKGAPSSIKAGQVVDLGMVAADFIVRGNNAFAVGMFMPGAEVLDPGGGDTGKGDPSASVATAIEQYRRRYIFLTPSDYDLGFVDIVAPKDATLTLDGETFSASSGRALGAYFVIRKDISSTGKGGVHDLTSDKAVGIQVMGYGSYTSFQYPGGLDLKRIAPPPIK